ncbi:MAG: hypothetical protein OXH08_09690 [Gammaproteobacteria bacterium]|nr:hypothetical protein [Gammaproteobacteria bacterium]
MTEDRLPRRSGGPPTGVGITVQPGERPIKVFVSSVMRPEFEEVRNETVGTLDAIPEIVPWAFEYTPGSSEPVDQAYLRHVREADFVVWLVTATTTEPVSDEVKEAIAASRKLWIVIIDPQSEWSDATTSLVDHARRHAKWIEPTRCGGLRTALQMTWEDEVIRSVRGIPSKGRVAKLESMASASRARCIARWQAAGVPREIALRMLEQTDVGSAPPALLPTRSHPVSLLTGDFGIGKSLAAERALQAAIAASQERQATAIPVFVPADELVGPLEAAVRQRATELGDPRTEGVFLVVDGLEQAGVGDALRILNQTRALVETWPSTLALVTSRTLPIATPIEEARPLPPLSDQAVQDLIARVSGRPVTPALAHGWPKPVQEAIDRPLFAILLGGYLREQTPVLPRSQADLISQLVDRSLQAAGLLDREARPVLGQLAVAITRRGGGSIQANEVGDPDALQDLASAGLVVMHDSLVRFPLPILLQWFSAHALGEGLVSLSEIARSGPMLDRWRYALVIAAGLFDHKRATNVLAPLARTHPGFVSQIVNEGLAEWGLDDTVPAPTGTEAADRIRQAMDAYVTGLGPLAKLIAPLQPSGDLLPVAARSSGPHLTVGWYRGRDVRPTVSELPRGFSILSASPEWTMCRQARPGRHSAWAWRWALEILTDGMLELLNSRRLRSTAVASRREEAWYGALALLDRGHHYAGPIALQDLKRLLSLLGRSGDLLIDRNWYDRALIWSAVDEATAAGSSELPIPHPGPDRPQGQSVWSPYSDAQLLQRTRSVFRSALEIYESIVAEWFPSFRDRLSTSVLLPAVLEGYLSPPESSKEGLAGAPGMTWRFRALPVGQASRVDIRLVAESEPWRFDWSESEADLARLRRLRPDAAEWVYYTEVDEMLHHLFQETPARKLAYRWLSHDLARIGWLERGTY